MNEDAYNPYQGYTQDKLYEFLSGYSLSRAPGSQYEYSNVGYGLLGHILSLRNQSNFETLMRVRILGPLEMRKTRLTPAENPGENRAQGHYGDQKVESWAKYMQNVTQGSGALESTIEDMLVYLEACMGITSSPLTKAIMLTQQSTYRLSDKYQDGIGLGWYLVGSEGEEITWKNGGNGGFTAFIGFSKTTGTGVVVLINSSLNPDPFQTQMGFQLLKKLKNL
jgi:CubicO group peptidase (beta-lactamase class C family)